MMSDEVSELKRSIEELKLELSKVQSHVQSELGNIGRILQDLNKQQEKTNHRIFGNGSEGLILKVDRLEQDSKRSSIWRNAAIGAVVATLIGLIFQAISFFGDKV